MLFKSQEPYWALGCAVVKRGGRTQKVDFRTVYLEVLTKSHGIISYLKSKINLVSSLRIS